MRAALCASRMLLADVTGEEKDVASDSYFKELLRGMSPQSPDYYHLVALELLMRFLKNPYGSLATVRYINSAVRAHRPLL